MAVTSRFIDARGERYSGPHPANGAIAPDAPPEAPEPKPTPLMRVLLPVVMVVAVVGMLALMVTAGAMRNPLTFMFPLMMVMSMVGMLAGGSQGQTDMGAVRRDYQRHLASVRRSIEQQMAQQDAHARFHHPNPEDVWAVVGTHRMWERGTSDSDFGVVRVGCGPQRPEFEVQVPDVTAPEKLDPVSAVSLREVIRAARVVPGLPISINVWAFPVVAISGDVDQARGVMRAMLAQLTAFHHPNDICVSAFDDSQQWDWLKWLPHFMPAQGPIHQRSATAFIVDAAESSDGVAAVDRGSSLLFDAAGNTSCATTMFIVTGGDEACEQWALEHGLLLSCENGTLYAITGAGREEIAVSDFLSTTAAESVARRMVGYAVPVADAGERSSAGDKALAELGLYPPAKKLTYTDRLGSQRLRIPIGSTEDGQVVHLDLKESAEGGVGPHGLCIGATGSGKSEVLRSVVTGLVATHGPDQLNLVLVDFKGGATFLGLESLPHVAAVITNLQDELVLVDRMQDAIRGEMVRRQEVLRKAGNFPGVAEYEAARRQGRTDLEPLPALVIVVDEFSELLGQRPEFADLFVAVGRLGRSLHMHLLLASQRLEEGRLRGLDSHLSYRIGLKTFSAAESRSVLGVPDAYQLPAIPGSGYLKTDADQPVRFRATYVSGPVAEAGGTQAAARGDADADQETNNVQVFSIAAISASLAQQQEKQVGAAAGLQVTAKADSHTTMEAVVSSLQHLPHTARQVWLPPLPAVMPFATVADSRGGFLRASIGVIDKPVDQRQDPYVVDISGTGGHCAIVGAPRSGKTTAARTFVLGLALTTPSSRLHVHVVDCGAGGLADLAELPHVSSVAHRGNSEQLRRTIGHIAGEITRREQQFRQNQWHSIEAARRAGVADIVLVIDGWPALQTEHMALADSVKNIISDGLAVGVHVCVTAHRWTELRPAIRDLMGSRIELRQAESIDSMVDRKAAKLVPESAGRGIVMVKKTPCAMLIAEATPHDTRTVAQACAERGDIAVPALELLPNSLTIDDVIERHPAVFQRGKVVLGLDEENLEPVYFDSEVERHMLVMGSSGCGRTSAVKTVVSGLLRTSRDVKCVVIDYRRGLLECVPQERLAGYAGSSAIAAPMIEELAGVLKSRLPGADVTPAQLKSRSWWDGPHIAVVIDDYDLVATTRSNPLLPLAELIPHAADIGLQIIISRRIGGVIRALHDPVMGAAKDSGASMLIMDGTREDGPISGVHPNAMPQGRAMLLRHGSSTQTVQIATVDKAVDAGHADNADSTEVESEESR